MIVLEDLRTLGYRTANRQFGLDIAHAELALELLAKFHAASAVYYEQVRKVEVRLKMLCETHLLSGQHFQRSFPVWPPRRPHETHPV